MKTVHKLPCDGNSVPILEYNAPSERTHDVVGTSKFRDSRSLSEKICEPETVYLYIINKMQKKADNPSTKPSCHLSVPPGPFLL